MRTMNVCVYCQAMHFLQSFHCRGQRISLESIENCNTAIASEDSIDIVHDSDNNDDMDQTNLKPSLSYIHLVGLALCNKERSEMFLSEICDFISDKFPYYRKANLNWKDEIRRTLNTSGWFFKCVVSNKIKWRIHPNKLKDTLKKLQKWASENVERINSIGKFSFINIDCNKLDNEIDDIFPRPKYAPSGALNDGNMFANNPPSTEFTEEIGSNEVTEEILKDPLDITEDFGVMGLKSSQSIVDFETLQPRKNSPKKKRDQNELNTNNLKFLCEFGGCDFVTKNKKNLDCHRSLRNHYNLNQKCKEIQDTPNDITNINKASKQEHCETMEIITKKKQPQNVKLIDKSGNHKEYALSFGWKKKCSKRVNGISAGRWDTVLICPFGTRFRSSVELNRYLKENPNIAHDPEIATVFYKNHQKNKKRDEITKPPSKKNEKLDLGLNIKVLRICPACGKEDDGSPKVACNICFDWFHCTCVGFPQGPNENKDWVCKGCFLKSLELVNVSTKVNARSMPLDQYSRYAFTILK